MNIKNKNIGNDYTNKYEKNFPYFFGITLGFLFFLTCKSLLLNIFVAFCHAYLLHSVVDVIEEKLKCPRWISCSVVLLGFVLSFLIPLLVILFSLYQECVTLYQSFPQFWAFISKSFSETVPLKNNIISTLDTFLQKSGFLVSEDISQFFSSLGYKIKDIFFALLKESNRYLGQVLLNLPKNLLSLVINLYLVFFLLLRGKDVISFISWMIPLEKEFKKNIILTTQNTLRGVVYGTVIIGITEGIYGGSILYCLGYQSCILWGSLMSIFSMIPLVGTNTILIPLSIFQLLLGNFWDSFIITGFGVFGILFSQNVIRVKIVGDLSGISVPLVVISTIGGITQWGITGFVIGPLVSSVFFSFLNETKKLTYKKYMKDSK